MSETLETALSWLSKGVAPIPILYKDKKPAIEWKAYQTQLPTENEIKSWFGVKRNLAIVTGWRNLVVVDFDTFEAYNEAMPPETYSVVTRRGIHCYYYVEETINGRKLPEIDIKAGGGYVLVPPSVHPSGVPYVALDPSAEILSVGSLDEILDVPKLPLTNTEWNGTDKSKVDIWYNADLVGAIKTRYEICDMVSIVKSSGRGWFMARCPFHEDNNPSFWIDSNRGICGCFSDCTDRPMDVIDLYARLRGVSNEEAIYEMGQQIGWYEEWR